MIFKRHYTHPILCEQDFVPVSYLLSASSGKSLPKGDRSNDLHKQGKFDGHEGGDVTLTIPSSDAMKYSWTDCLFSLLIPAWYILAGSPLSWSSLAPSSACACRVTYTIAGPVRSLRIGMA